MKRKHIFLILAVLGFVYPWYYNYLYFTTVENATLITFFQDAQMNYAGQSFGADLTVVMLAFYAFAIPEALRLKIKYWWVIIPATFLVALAFAFPLFLLMREKALEKTNTNA